MPRIRALLLLVFVVKEYNSPSPSPPRVSKVDADCDNRVKLNGPSTSLHGSVASRVKHVHPPILLGHHRLASLETRLCTRVRLDLLRPPIPPSIISEPSINARRSPEHREDGSIESTRRDRPGERHAQSRVRRVGPSIVLLPFLRRSVLDPAHLAPSRLALSDEIPN